MSSVSIASIQHTKLQAIAQNSDINKDNELKDDELFLFAKEATMAGFDYDTISKTLDLNAAERWFYDVDKVCTDGKDDGTLTFGEGIQTLGKVFLKPLLNIAKNPVEAFLYGAIATGITVATGGAALPIIGGLVAGIGAVNAASGVYKAATAKNDSDAKFALENIGEGLSTVALSAFAFKGSKMINMNKAFVAKCQKELNIAKKDPFNYTFHKETSLETAEQALSTNLEFLGFGSGQLAVSPAIVSLKDNLKNK